MIKRTVVAIALGCAATANVANPQDISTADAAATFRDRPASDEAPLQPRPAVRVEQHGNEILVHAQSDVRADPATIWATLSDYDHLAQFIPDVSSSRVIWRE